MCFIILSFRWLVTVYIFGVIPKSDSWNFPLDGCSRDEMDVLCLYFDSTYKREQENQRSMCALFVQDLSSFPSNKSRSRVMLADVIDRFSAYNSKGNISTWNFQSSLGSEPYGDDDHLARKQQYKNVREVIDKKTQFVQRLFSEMGGVRENVTHIAVMFIDGSGLSFEESRSIPHIIQQQDTDIKIFVVVYNKQKHTEMVYLSDTLLIYTQSYLKNKRILTLTICNQCMPGWFVFHHTDSTDSLSCYKLLTLNEAMSNTAALTRCQDEGAYLAAIETKQELTFIRDKMYSYFTELIHQSQGSDTISHLHYQVYIGLRRFMKDSSGRFYWDLSDQRLSRPLVINNWMGGKPSGGRSNECGLWKFVWNYKNGSNNPETDNHFKEGWADFVCENNVALFGLCEMSAPRRSADTCIWRIKPSKKEIFDQVLTKGDFINFGDNIVSVSANIGSMDFRQFLLGHGGQFPLFDCGVDDDLARYISYVNVCDYIAHCSNRRDETFCMLEPQERNRDQLEYTHNCKGLHCCDGFCLPLQWVNDGEIDCSVCRYSAKDEITDESEVLINYLNRNETCAFICNHGKCVHFSDLNDGHKDCTGPDGSLDETIGKLEMAYTCYDILGHVIWAPRCVYVKDRYGAIIGCRDASHLEDCNDYNCPEGYFKCPNTYCIPQHYVLDGKADCPTGEDEQIDCIDSCKGNFACWNSAMCLHPDLVCDGHPDCPHRDDEVDCHVLCTKGFRCVSGTVTVSDYNRSIPLGDVYPIDSRIRYLDLSGVDLSITDFTPLGWSENVIVIVWSNCQIGNSISSYFSYLWRVRELDLSYNLIQVLDGAYMSYSPLQNVRRLNLSYNAALTVVKYLEMTFLETLDLSHTGLSDVDASFLVGLPNLKHLNVSYTGISDFMINVFPSNLILRTLDLRGLYIEIIHTRLFNDLTITQHLYTDSFEMCCPQIRGPNIPYYTCHGPEDAISSCFNLIGLDSQRVLLWVFSILAVLGNMAVIIYHVVWERSVLRTAYGLFVTNLGISDFIMGVNMFIIVGADYYYQDNYVLSHKIWRESLTCRLAGFLATLSSEMSLFLTFLITLDRVLLIKLPSRLIQLPKRNIIVSLFVFWMIGFLLALCPIVIRMKMYSFNAMCLGLPLTNERFKGWEFSFGVFTALNFCMCLVIAYGQSVIFGAMSGNRFNGIELHRESWPTEDILVAKQMSIVALSSCLCWCYVGIISLLSLAGHKINNEVYGWVTVIVVPINSAVNPIIYILPALVDMWEKFKHGH